MERDQGFTFKLFVPPRMNTSQINAVRPQEIVEKPSELNTVQQSFNRSCNKEPSMTLFTTSVVAPSVPTRQDLPKMKVVSPLEKDENNCTPGNLCSKLLDEVEKIKFWKVKVDTDTVQKERKLQDNKRTIETQRKAIQELQFSNESLSIKLEEQINENEDLRNKNNTTRNLCCILKETFQWSAEKMHLFESEREGTHHLFTENSENIKKLTAAFDSLRIRVEADQQEMQKVKESVQEFVDLKEKYQQEHAIKDEEFAKLQTKLHDKKDELQKVLKDLSETQKYCKRLQDSTNQQFELLKSLKSEKECLLQKLHTAEQCCEESQKKLETTVAALEQSKKEHDKLMHSKDLSMEELRRAKTQQADKLEKIETALLELKESLALKTERTKELEEQLMINNQQLEKSTKHLGEIMEQAAEKDDCIKTLEDELNIKSELIESFTSKIDIFEFRIKELVADLSRKTEEIEMFRKERDMTLAENGLLKEMCENAEKDKEDFMEKSTFAEVKVQELKEELSAEKKKNTECTCQMEQVKMDLLQQEVKYEELRTSFDELLSEKASIQQEFEKGLSKLNVVEANKLVSEEKAVKLQGEIHKLEEENQSLRDEVIIIKTKVQRKCEETENVQKKMEEKFECLQEEITEKEKQIKAVEAKLYNLRKKFESKFQTQEEHKKENKLLKKQIAKETAKSSHLEMKINKLQNESQNLKKLKDEDYQKLLRDLELKSTSAADLENEVQKLRLTTAEAVKNKEEAELKCQHQIADMVALMEKHKSQYDRMVEEKDAKLNENKKKEMEAAAITKSLELDFSKLKTENDELRKQLNTQATEKETLEKEVADLKRERMTSAISQSSQAQTKQSPASNYKLWKSSNAAEMSSVKSKDFDFSMKTPSYSSDKSTVALKKAVPYILGKDMETPRGDAKRISGTSKIKSYRIKTPPSTEKAGRWGRGTFELDPKSDSSDHLDLVTCPKTPAQSLSVPQCKLDFRKKMQSPAILRSPGNSSKVAAIKRMRDAGWTTVTGCDKKKKHEKIFA